MGKKNQKLNLDKATLYEMYVNKEMSPREIGDELGCTGRSVRNYLKKYNIQIRTLSEAGVIAMNNRTPQVLEKRARKFRNTWYSRPLEEREAINKTKATKPENIDSAIEKARKTKLERGHRKESKAENDFYKSLLISFPDAIHGYTDDRYPFDCDFYIPSRDLFVEYQGHITHGTKPYCECTEEEIQMIVESTSLDMSTFVKRDPNKLNIALNNKINLVLIYPHNTHYLINNGKITTLEISELWKM